MRDELPLRGYLECPRCGRVLTGSASIGRSGEKFHYYHCSKGCKERIKALDLMIGKNHQGALLVTIDRASLHTRLRLLKSKESKEVTKSLLNIYKDSNDWIKTITFDNDKAFTNHEEVANTLDVKTYFTRPYTSQDKGSVENRIGVIRRFFPKKTDLTKINHQQVYRVQELLNNRPVRKFKYKTPNQVFSEKIALIT